MARYSLVFESFREKEIVKLHNPKTGEKDTLTKSELYVIDSGTLCFADEADLIDYLYRHKKIKSNKGKLYITYVVGKKEKRLPIVYNNEELRSLANQLKKSNSESNCLSHRIVSRFLHDMMSKKFYTYIICNNYVNDYLKNKLNDYFYNPDGYRRDEKDMLFIRNKIIAELLSYKNIRSIIIGTLNYQNENRKQSVSNRSVDTSDEEINEAFERGGYEEVFNLFSADRIYSLSENDLINLGLLPKEKTYTLNS